VDQISHYGMDSVSILQYNRVAFDAGTCDCNFVITVYLMTLQHCNFDAFVYLYKSRCLIMEAGNTLLS